MGEQVSKALIKLMEELCQIETQEMKVQGVLFTRRCTNIIKEKVSYLENLLEKEASSYNQKMDKFYTTKNYIITTYKEKLNRLYKEYYLQYVNIQDELLEARFRQRAIMIKYQNLINKKENDLKNPLYIKYMETKKALMQKLNSAKDSAEYNEIYVKINELKSPVSNNESKKEELKSENEKYQKIINLCNQKFMTCRANFENQVNSEFLVATSLITSESSSFINKIKSIFINIFMGAQKFTEVLENYKEMIEKINCDKIVEDMRNETINFVEQTLEIKMEFEGAVAV